MTIEVAFLISLITVGVTIFQAIVSNRRSNIDEYKKAGAQLTTIVVQLDQVIQDIQKLNKIQEHLIQENQEIKQRVIVLEQYIKKKNL